MKLAELPRVELVRSESEWSELKRKGFLAAAGGGWVGDESSSSGREGRGSSSLVWR